MIQTEDLAPARLQVLGLWNRQQFANVEGNMEDHLTRRSRRVRRLALLAGLSAAAVIGVVVAVAASDGESADVRVPAVQEPAEPEEPGERDPVTRPDGSTASGGDLPPSEGNDSTGSADGYWTEERMNDAEPDPDSENTAVPGATNPAKEQPAGSADDYWTEERMNDAEPAPDSENRAVPQPGGGPSDPPKNSGQTAGGSPPSTTP